MHGAAFSLFIPPAQTVLGQFDEHPYGCWFGLLLVEVQRMVQTWFGGYIMTCLRGSAAGICHHHRLSAVALSHSDGYDALLEILRYAGHTALQEVPGQLEFPEQSEHDRLEIYIR